MSPAVCGPFSVALLLAVGALMLPMAQAEPEDKPVDAREDALQEIVEGMRRNDALLETADIEFELEEIEYKSVAGSDNPTRSRLEDRWQVKGAKQRIDLRMTEQEVGDVPKFIPDEQLARDDGVVTSYMHTFNTDDGSTRRAQIGGSSFMVVPMEPKELLCLTVDRVPVDEYLLSVRADASVVKRDGVLVVTATAAHGERVLRIDPHRGYRVIERTSTFRRHDGGSTMRYRVPEW